MAKRRVQIKRHKRKGKVVAAHIRIITKNIVDSKTNKEVQAISKRSKSSRALNPRVVDMRIKELRIRHSALTKQNFKRRMILTIEMHEKVLSGKVKNINSSPSNSKLTIAAAKRLLGI